MSRDTYAAVVVRSILLRSCTVTIKSLHLIDRGTCSCTLYSDSTTTEWQGNDCQVIGFCLGRHVVWPESDQELLMNSDQSTSPSAAVIESRQLACGSTLLVESNSSLRSTSVTWLIPTGSMHDALEDENSGVSILCSGMLERGAGSLNSRDFNDALDRLGAIRSVSIHPMSTQINASFRCESIEPVLKLLSDMACRPRFSEDSFESVRSLCLQSIEGLVDDPSALASNHLRRIALPPPYNRDIYGSSEVIASASLKEVSSAWLQRGRPEGGIIAIAGDVQIDHVASLLDTALDDWSGAPPQRPVARGALGGDHHVQLPTSQVHLEMAFPAPALGSEEELPFLVATRILGGGASSRLFESVRERQGLCYDVHSGYARSTNASLCLVGAGTTPDRVEQTLHSIYTELERLGRDGVTTEEFDRVTVGLKTRLMMHGDSTSARALAMTEDLHQRGRARTMREIAGEIDQLQHGEVDALVRRFMTEEWRSSAVRVAVGPESPYS